ncbi:MAG: extracellular solute-binding protein [Streptosporangiales bacterium]|nr:extracellular solute-binding protein [Streptosporangiales bacterium]
MTNSMNRRDVLKLFGATAGAAGLGGLAACTPQARKGGSTGGDAKAKNFTFLAWEFTAGPFKAPLQGYVDQYAKAHDLHVKTTAFPYVQYLNQFTLQTRGGQFTGLAQFDVSWLAAADALGKLRDLGDAAKGKGYTETALKSGQLNGKQLGLPWSTASIGLIGNQELLDKAKVTEPPTTLDDFVEALQMIKGRAKVLPYAAMTKSDELKDIVMWMQTFGSPIVEGDRVTIGDDASIEAMTWYKSLLDKKLIGASVNRDDARALFAHGKAAIFDDAIVGKGIVASETKDKGLVQAMTPMVRPVQSSGDSPQERLWGHVLVVVEGTGSDAATDFGAWLSTDEKTVLDYFTKFTLPPTTEKTLASPTFTKDEFASAWTKKITSTATPDPLWKYVKYTQMESALAEQVQAVLVGKSSPKAAMTTAGEQMRKLTSS